ncbi:MAG TPA: response regulator [Cyclobacteriaceae bacterium]|nr:response regulator [Cyclobacteriaceae bacterium]
MEKVILCIDDEKIILDSLRMQLRRELGYQYGLELAENAEDGLALMEELTDSGVKVIVILTDWLMPGMKGDEFLIKVHQRFPGIVKIMLSGYVDDESIAKAYKEANLFKYLRKPWESEELVSTIRQGLTLLDEKA